MGLVLMVAEGVLPAGMTLTEKVALAEPMALLLKPHKAVGVPMVVLMVAVADAVVVARAVQKAREVTAA